MRGLSPLFLGVGVHSLDFVFELKAEKRISWHFGACNLTLERQFKLQLCCEIFVSKSNVWDNKLYCMYNVLSCTAV